MTTTIERRNKAYVVYHDGERFHVKEIKHHFESNGHKREHIGFVGYSMDDYHAKSAIARKVDAIFDEKEDPKNKPARFRK